jgi:hypothetical protein
MLLSYIANKLLLLFGLSLTVSNAQRPALTAHIDGIYNCRHEVFYDTVIKCSMPDDADIDCRWQSARK